MNIDTYELRAIKAIKELQLSGVQQEAAYKKAVMHAYNLTIHLYYDAYYATAIREALNCADMAVKLFLWKKHMANYSDYHNLPMHRILNWFPDKTMEQTVADLRKLHTIYEQFGNYMEMVEEYPEHLYSTPTNDIFDEEVINHEALKQAAKEALCILDASLVILLKIE